MSLFVLVALDHDLDDFRVALMDQFKGILALIEFKPVGDESFDVDLAAGDQVNRCPVATCRIPDAAPNGQVADTRRGDGDGHILQEQVSIHDVDSRRYKPTSLPIPAWTYAPPLRVR